MNKTVFISIQYLNKLNTQHYCLFFLMFSLKRPTRTKVGDIPNLFRMCGMYLHERQLSMTNSSSNSAFLFKTLYEPSGPEIDIKFEK